MSRKKKRKSTDGGESLTQNPFEALTGLDNLPAGEGLTAGPTPAVENSPTSRRGRKNTNRGRVDIIRQTAHRGGKAVTVVRGFGGISREEIRDLAKKMQKRCGVGGTVKDGRIEIQGDKREEVRDILEDAGFNPVFAGG